MPISRLYVCKGNKKKSINPQFGDFFCKMLVELLKVCNLDKKPTQKGIYIHNGKKVCHNLRGYGNGAFASLATAGKGTMGGGVTDISKNKQSQET